MARSWTIGWLLCAAVVAAGCTSGSKAASSSATTRAAGSASTVVAKSGSGQFCKDLASSTNAFAAITGQAASTPDAFRTQIQSVVKAIDKLTSEAPSDIKSSMVTLQQAFGKADAALAKVNYDVTKIDASNTDVQALGGAPVQGANDKVTQYAKQQCGIDVTTSSTT